MLALYTLNICQSLTTGHSRKVFYTDKGFLRALCTFLSSLFHRAVDRAVCCISAGPISQMIVLHCNALTKSNMILAVPTRNFMWYKRILYTTGMQINEMLMECTQIYCYVSWRHACCSMLWHLIFFWYYCLIPKHL